MRLIEGNTLIFLSYLIASFVIALSVFKSITVLIDGHKLAIYFDHLLSKLIVTMMHALFINFNPISVLIIFDWIVVGVVLNQVPIMVIYFRHPFRLYIPINLTFLRLLYILNVLVFDRLDVCLRAQLFKALTFIKLLVFPRFEEGGLKFVG